MSPAGPGRAGRRDHVDTPAPGKQVGGRGPRLGAGGSRPRGCTERVRNGSGAGLEELEAEVAPEGGGAGTERCSPAT